MDIPQLSPQELEARMVVEPELVVLDVRPTEERSIATLPGSVHIPASQLVRRIDELDPDAPTVVLCHFGIRSMAATALLLERDFDDVCSLTGGIDLYAREVAPDIPRY